jgi:KRAB domain-containing zinc finger protein
MKDINASNHCEVCNKVFTLKANLKKHQIVHQENKPWTCNKCDKSFNQKRDYNSHMTQRHTSKRPNECSVFIVRF